MEEQLALIDRKVDEGMRLDGQGMVNEGVFALFFRCFSYLKI